MRIVTWNCNGGLWKKFEALSTLEADLFVIQECEDPERSNRESYRNWARNFLWKGDNKNKGIGFFAKKGIILEQLNWSNLYESHEVKYFLPVLVNGQIKMLGVWAHSNNSPTFGYIGQFWKYLKLNLNNLSESIILGDFNSNKIWDRWDRWWNHSDVIKELASIKIKSLYHTFYNEAQGTESMKTYYMYRDKSKGYHIDYIFSSEQYSKKIKSLAIGDLDWLEHSDHLPLYVDIDFNL